LLPVSRTAWPAGRYGSTVRRRPGQPALPACTHDVAPSLARGHAERRRSGACSQQARHPRPSPPRPLKGRVCGSCPEPGTGKRPGSSAELTTFGWTPLVTERSGPTGAGKQARRPPRRCSPPSTARTPRHWRLPVARWRRQGRGPRRRWLPSSQPGQHRHRRPASGTHRPRRNPRLAVPRWGHGARMRSQRSTCRLHPPVSATRIRLRRTGRGMRGCSSPRMGRSPSWPGDLVRAGLGR
jgi:hypothetical protein